MPHPSLGILSVPLIAGNEVNMDMKDALPGRRPYVDADVVAIRIKFLIKASFLLFYDIHAGSHFFIRQFEKAGDMPTRNDQGMPRTRWIGVTGAESKLMLYGNPAWILAKQAWIIGVSFLFLCCCRRQFNTFL